MLLDETEELEQPHGIDAPRPDERLINAHTPGRRISNDFGGDEFLQIRFDAHAFSLVVQSPASACRSTLPVEVRGKALRTSIRSGTM